MDKVISKLIFDEGIDPERYYIVILDGVVCRNVGSFYREISKAFNFPDYFGGNLNSLGEILDDLEWIDKPNYALIIENSMRFLSEEPKELRAHILSFLQRVSKEWANVPSFEGEEIDRKRADFRVILI